MLMCVCFRVAQCMKGLTLWELETVLSCAANCAVCYSFARIHTHTHTYFALHRAQDHTLCIHFITFIDLYIHSHIICLPVSLCCCVSPSPSLFHGVCADSVVVTQTDYRVTFKLRVCGWMWSGHREALHEVDNQKEEARLRGLGSTWQGNPPPVSIATVTPL